MRIDATQTDPQEHMTSTEKLRATMDQFLGISPRESVLEDRELHDNDLTDE
jgi:hypothetical protein